MKIRYLMLDNGIEFEDKVVAGSEWKDLKPKTVCYCMPVQCLYHAFVSNLLKVTLSQAHKVARWCITGLL